MSPTRTGSRCAAFPELQFVLVDDETGELAAEGHTLAIPWDGTVEGLPDGFDGIFEPGLSAAPKSALCAMAPRSGPPTRARASRQGCSS
jgi:hypothetical protein